MIRRPPRSTRTDTLFPYTTLFRSWRVALLGLDELQAGMVLAADAEHVSGRVLLRKGVCLSDDHLRIFRQWGVTAVDIEGVAARPGVEAELEQRSEGRRVGKEGVSTCRLRVSACLLKKKRIKNKAKK